MYDFSSISKNTNSDLKHLIDYNNRTSTKKKRTTISPLVNNVNRTAVKAR